MLDDFKEIKAWSQRTGILTRVLSSVAGYCVALIVKTLPKTIAHSSHQVNVRVTTNRPSETLWVDHRRGDFVQRISCPTSTTNASSTPPGCRTAPGTSPPAQTILFEGETGILAAGTAPYYGGGLRLFPFARMTIDKMHLRIGRIHPVTGFFKIPAIFAGSYRDKSDRFGVLDFLGTDFGVQILPKSNSDTTDQMSGFPLQHSGESVGSVDSIQLRVIEQPIRFLNLLKER